MGVNDDGASPERQACLFAVATAGRGGGVAQDRHQNAAQPKLLCVYCVLGCVLAACEGTGPERGITQEGRA